MDNIQTQTMGKGRMAFKPGPAMPDGDWLNDMQRSVGALSEWMTQSPSSPGSALPGMSDPVRKIWTVGPFEVEPLGPSGEGGDDRVVVGPSRMEVTLAEGDSGHPMRPGRSSGTPGILRGPTGEVVYLDAPDIVDLWDFDGSDLDSFEELLEANSASRIYPLAYVEAEELPAGADGSASRLEVLHIWGRSPDVELTAPSDGGGTLCRIYGAPSAGEYPVHFYAGGVGGDPTGSGMLEVLQLNLSEEMPIGTWAIGTWVAMRRTGGTA